MSGGRAGERGRGGGGRESCVDAGNILGIN